MNKNFFMIGLCMPILVFSQDKKNASLISRNKAFNVANKKVIVYTTDSIKCRLTLTGTLTFSDFGQPLETQPSVFVDPSHSFQTLVGIGGALTDAAAENFAKLSPGKQTELL
jgi:glucosylceramidase